MGGELELSLLDGYEQSIQADDTFAVITADGIDGAFANVANGERLFTADGLGSFLVHYGQDSAFNPNHVVLSSFLVPEPAGVLWLGAAALLGMLRRRGRHMMR